MTELLFWLITAVITSLGLANAWFIRGLIQKIEASSQAVHDMRKDLLHLQEKIAEISDLSRRIVTIEKQLTLLEFIVRKDTQPYKEES